MIEKPELKIYDAWDLKGIAVRVVAGNHGNGDRVLELKATSWRKMPMALGALQADFYDQNEPRRYRYTGEFEGRMMYPRLLNLAVKVGWEAAVAELITRFGKSR